MANKKFDIVLSEILEEIKIESEISEKEKAKIIKNGCPHTNKVEIIGTLTKKHFLECKICGKQFHMDGTEILL